MAGTACGSPGIVATYADRLHTSTHRGITGRNFGVPGDTSLDLLSRLESDPQLPAAVAAADIVIVTVGANDLLPQEQQQAAGGCPGQCYCPVTQTMGTQLGPHLPKSDYCDHLPRSSSPPTGVSSPTEPWPAQPAHKHTSNGAKRSPKQPTAPSALPPTIPALHNPGCSRGLKPPVSSSDLAM